MIKQRGLSRQNFLTKNIKLLFKNNGSIVSVMIKENKYKNLGGFTLIETIVYIALLSLMMGGVLAVTFQLMTSTESVNTKTSTAEEGNFVLRKINWVLTGLDPTIPPTVTGLGCAQILTTTNNWSSTIIKRDTTNNSVLVQEGSGGSFLPVTNDTASTTCLRFELISGTPAGVSATATINGIDFATTKYIRQ